MVAKALSHRAPRAESERPQRRIKRLHVAAGAPQLDPLVHERVRLGIASALAVNPSLTFPDLKKLLNTTDGNLSVHARKLEEAGYIHCAKSFDGRIPRTEYRLTASGRNALERYLNEMERLIRAARNPRV
jgi:DNA-binding MarR family transcriptional regulator